MSVTTGRTSLYGHSLNTHALARAQIPPSPSPFNAGHAGYTEDSKGFMRDA